MEYETDDIFGNFGFRNKSGEVVIEPCFAYHENSVVIADRVDGRVATVGLVSRDGELLMPNIYEKIFYLRHGFYAGKRGERMTLYEI